MAMKARFKQSDLSDIPEGWEVCPVRTKGDVVTGKALAARAPGPQRPYLRTKNVFDGRIDIEDVLTMPMTDSQFAQFEVLPNDVLLNEGQSLELVGRCAIYRDEYPERCAMQNQLLRFRAHKGTSPLFASHLFRRCQQTGVFARIALQTTSIAHLGGSRFERLRLAWPSDESEQIAIAEALSDVDELLAGLDRLISKKRDLKQAAMQQLLTGRTRLPGFKGKWELMRLGDLFNFKNGLNKGKQFFGRGTPIVNYMDVFRASTILAPKLVGRVSVTASELAAFDVRTGDVFFTRTSETTDEIGVASVIKGEVQDTVFSGFLLRARPLNGRLHDSFKAYCFEATAVRRQIVSRASYTTRALTNGKILSEVTLTVPALAEQAAIADVLSDMDAELSALEARRDKTRALKQGMMQELLTGRTRLV